ncbi:hypothetical protein CLV24_11438 [Pontibacter ummariensis]|uniref:Uncharacterized protein n=1 Tax=Pontibacter ummariensis TaxID=1610492 RepID=A0A239HKN5_9BACT|nr:hypothetical protein [Pontibacter ummariensis]PRY10310.1 hypothetical protein CLV24_11438 [Pontibacter ummariensis]SNS81956.1 hypothetical protein SAMN06296052_11438 [Pontibacter ummariensis]
MSAESKRLNPAYVRNRDKPILKAYLKHCPICDQVKDRDDFWKHPTASDGRHPRCKQRENEKARQKGGKA